MSLNFDFNGSDGKPVPDCYFSAPTSPNKLYQFCNDFDELLQAAGGDRRRPTIVQFDREEKPGSRKLPVRDNNGEDFAFDLSQEWDTASLSAEELFDGGVIRPLTPPPPPKLPAGENSGNTIASPGKLTSKNRRSIQGAGWPPAVAAPGSAVGRGRETAATLSKSRASRSLSPHRDAEYPKGQKKWRLKDFFLFRSASEGRAAEKDPLKKYTSALRRSSFGSIEAAGSGLRRNGAISAHELHYTVNRALSEDLKKKTFLPYKQGIVGHLAFNPAVHALANGFGFSRR